jgi:hypothetical protein
LFNQPTQNAVFNLGRLLAPTAAHTDNAGFNDLANFFENLRKGAFSVDL